MHPTRDTHHFINLKRAGGRVMPGVRLLVESRISGYEMSVVKKTITIVLMLIFMIGGGVAATFAFLRLTGSFNDLVSGSASGPVLGLFLVCLELLTFMVGLCLGALIWLLAMRPFVSKQEMYDVFISDPKHQYPHSTDLLESLLELIY